TGVHGIQGGTRWGWSTRPPRGHVRVHEMFSSVERLTVRTNKLLARLRAAAPNDTLEGRPVGEQAPEPMMKTESGLDDELGSVVRQGSARSPRGSLEGAALRGRRRPYRKSSGVHFIEHHLHPHMGPPGARRRNVP